MAHAADPLTSARFLVQIEGLTAHDFVEVLFPEATVIDGRQQLTHLALRRAAGVDRQLADWWQQAANGKAAPKGLSVTLLDSRGETQVRWNFRAAQPVRYTVTGLSAVAPAVVVETLELAVATFERE